MLKGKGRGHRVMGKKERDRERREGSWKGMERPGGKGKEESGQREKGRGQRGNGREGRVQ